ncbi:neurofilament heavy polypeptide-like [Zingiber officinale]|uniref:neurofilament heavy polypeptide-like n=1 Tax=Zingiber officinale TaxID=94328 RepID=UPI001C4CCF2C|nr:neurofilament heavy polypeptide-like [Zingiber officinale]
MVEQQQKAQAERIAQQATSASGGRAAPEDRPEQLSIWGQNKGPTGTQVEAPPAPIPFHRALFQTPSEVAQANLDRGSSSDEATERLKLRAAEIEAAKNKEIAERGLAPADPASEEGEGTQDVPEALAAPASHDEAAGDLEPSTQVEVEGRSADDVPLATRKRKQPEATSQPIPSDEPQSERGDEAPVLSGAVSIESTPTSLGSPRATSEVPPSSPPRTLRRIKRLGDRPSSSAGEPSGKATASKGDPSGPTLIKTILRLPSEEYMAAADRPIVPEQQITLMGTLAKVWEDARLRIAMMTPGQLGDSNLQQATEDELKKLKAVGDSRQSTAALEKAKRLLEAERSKTFGLTSEVARLEALVKQRDKEVKTATARKLKAIDDMDLMKVENRGLEQQVKELDASITAEREGRSADRTKAEGALQDLQAALDASQTALKDYHDGEPGRSAEVRKAFVRSDEFGEKFTDKLSLTFEEAIKVVVDYMKNKGHAPADLSVPAEDLATMMGSIPDHLFNFDD